MRSLLPRKGDRLRGTNECGQEGEGKEGENVKKSEQSLSKGLTR